MRKPAEMAKSTEPSPAAEAKPADVPAEPAKETQPEPAAAEMTAEPAKPEATKTEPAAEKPEAKPAPSKEAAKPEAKKPAAPPPNKKPFADLKDFARPSRCDRCRRRSAETAGTRLHPVRRIMLRETPRWRKSVQGHTAVRDEKCPGRIGRTGMGNLDPRGGGRKRNGDRVVGDRRQIAARVSMETGSQDRRRCRRICATVSSVFRVRAKPKR